MLVVLVGASAFAQGQVPAFCLAADPADPDYDITDYEPVRDADDWCKLAYNEPHKARRQLAKAVSLVRTANNRNRIYFDPKTGSPPGLYIQLLRPWMAEQNAAGTHDWRVAQGGIESGYSHHFTATIRNLVHCNPTEYHYDCGQYIRLTVNRLGADLDADGYQMVHNADVTRFNCTGETHWINESFDDLTAASTKEAIEGQLDQVEADCTDYVPNQ